jgi:hypothetical protein
MSENTGTVEPQRTQFNEWCDLYAVKPTKELETAFWGGFKHAKERLGNPAPYTLKLAPFTETVIQAYGQRDKAQEEVKELTRHLAKANQVNVKMHKLLEAARELIDVYG